MPSHSQPQHLLTISAAWISLVHTLFALSAFGGGLIIGVYLHYQKIVKNEWYGYPLEWFPSVSATLGDYYPERSLFQILIAFTSGPRLGLVFFSYLFQRHFASRSTIGINAIALCGLLRTISCGGWVYVTSSDDHDWHDVMMISYLVLTIPWQWGTIQLTPSNAQLTGNKYRKRFSALFFISVVPLVYFYIQHKVNRVPGAYTYYSLIEWSLIFYDVLYDSCTILDFAHFNITFSARPKTEIPILSWTGMTTKLLTGGLQPGSLPETMKTPKASVLTQDTLGTTQIRLFCAEVYLGFVFWTTLTALGPTIFYFSVWSMGLDGMEVLLFSTLSPFLLCLPLVRSFLLKITPALHLISLLSIGSYMVDRDYYYDDSVLRLQMTAASVGLCTLLTVAGWAGSQNELELQRKLAGFGLGLVGTVLIKYANYSLNPMWPIMRMNNGGYHRLGLFLGLLANLELFLASHRGIPSLNPGLERAVEQISGVTGTEADNAGHPGDQKGNLPPSPAPSCLRWWGASLGFGALIFQIHTLFTDSGTILAWVWTGYPIKGPTTVRHGYLVVLAMCTGLFMSTASLDGRLGFSAHPGWYIIGLVASFGLVRFDSWLGFTSGLLLCVFTFSQFERFVRNSTNCACPKGWESVGLSFGLSFLVYDLLELAHTFTVAYAFVPGGHVFRERTDLIMAVTMGLIGLGFFQNDDQITRRAAKTQRQISRLLRKALALAAAVALVVMWWRTELMAKEIVPYHSEDRVFKAGIWTIHFGVDSGMWESQRRIKDIIEELELDVVGLLESDLQRIVMGNRDLTQYIAEELGMYVDSGPGPNKHTWGAALLSKFPIVNSTHHLLPSPHGELAPAIHATLDVFGTMVDVIVSHNGQEEDPLDRELQSKELARIMRDAYPRPFVFLGYVVTQPHAPRPAPYRILIEDGKMLDIEPLDSDRWCEYILFRGLRRVGYARVTRGATPAVTDTELQIGSFQIPPSWVIVDPDRDMSNYERVPEGAVKESMRFSRRLIEGGENGFNGHQYHVLKEQFGTDVLYYKLW